MIDADVNPAFATPHVVDAIRDHLAEIRSKKLVLASEAIRNLDTFQISQIAGGDHREETLIACDSQNVTQCAGPAGCPSTIKPSN